MGDKLTESPQQNNNKSKGIQTNPSAKTVLLHASESWKITHMTLSRLQVISKCLQRIIKRRWPGRISNKELSKKTGEEPVREQ